MAAKASGAMLYCGVAAAEVRLEPLGLITACYHHASGQTHLLMEPSPEILDHLWGQCRDVDALAAALSADFDVSSDEGSADFRDQLTARLDELCAIGLVRRDA